MAVAVLVLKAFARERGTPGSSTQEKASNAHICGGPNEVGDALESEHGVENKKRNGVDSVSGVSGAGGDKRRHGARLGDSFFQNLAVFGFFVVEQSLHVHRLVALADTGINSDGAEERLHSEGASFVRHDGDD